MPDQDRAHVRPRRGGRFRDPEYAEAIAPLLALPLADQLRAYEALRESLAAAAPAETAADRQLRVRAEALEVLRRVGAELGLPPGGRGPTAKQFDTAAAKLELDWTSARVREAWGSWRFALDARRRNAPMLSSAS